MWSPCVQCFGGDSQTLLINTLPNSRCLRGLHLSLHSPTQPQMCAPMLVLLAATLAAIQVDCGVAEYSVYIAEDHLTTYYMGTDYEDLVNGESISESIIGG